MNNHRLQTKSYSNKSSKNDAELEKHGGTSISSQGYTALTAKNRVEELHMAENPIRYRSSKKESLESHEFVSL